MPAEWEALDFGLEELVDEGLDAWLTPVLEGVFAPRVVLVCWAESVDEVKIDEDELESEGEERAGFEAESDTREGRRSDER